MAQARFRRLRKFFESIAYVGLQPGAQAAPSKRARWLGPLRRPVERFLSGGPAPSDPLYLTNRTVGSKVRNAVVIGVPCLLVAGGLYGVMTNSFDFGDPQPAFPEASTAEAVSKLLPHLDPNIRIDTDRDVSVIEVRVEHTSPMALAGVVKNNTDHEIRIAQAVFDVTDQGGSQLGAVTTQIDNLKAGSTANFRLVIPQTTAAFALVREIHVQ